ncbi:hypothetical protein ACS0TY_031007 [Phlomoides rotata]
MNWYLRITRKVVGMPASLRFGALKKIARIASVMSTQGMNSKQIVEAFTRIRDIADNGLGVHFGCSENDVGKRKDDAKNSDLIDPSQS